MVLAQGTLRYRRRNATFGPEPCVVLSLMQGTLFYGWRNATFGPEPCVVLAPMQGTLHYRRRNATFSPEPCFIPVNAARAYELGKPTNGKWRVRREASPLALVLV